MENLFALGQKHSESAEPNLDITMPGRSGLEIFREIRKRDTRVPIIIVSMHGEEDFAVKAIQGGANGYIFKTGMKEEILDGIDHAVV